MSVVVLDASAGVEIAARTIVGRRLRARIPVGSTTWVPEHYFVEAVSVIRRAELNGRLLPARAQQVLDRLLAMPASRASLRPLLPHAWTLRANLTVADALYVVLAGHLDAELVTTDLRLCERTRLAGPNDHTLTADAQSPSWRWRPTTSRGMSRERTG